MARTSSRIDAAARRLLCAVAATPEARVSAVALAHKPESGKQLLDAGLIVRRGSTQAAVAEDDLDDAPVRLTNHPTTTRLGHLGAVTWQDEDHAESRRIYVLDLAAVASRVASAIDCSLAKDPVAHLDGEVLDFGSARLPRRNARVGMWVARSLASPRSFARFRDLVARRPSEGLRIVFTLDPSERFRPPYLRGHEFVALADAVDNEDGIAVSPDILAARLMMGPSQKGPVWVAGDGGVLIIHGKQHDFTGGKQKVAVGLLAQAWLDGERVQPVEKILAEAECGPSMKRLKDLFRGHRTWQEVIRESGSNCWLEV
jgi:hypothetical protein